MYLLWGALYRSTSKPSILEMKMRKRKRKMNSVSEKILVLDDEWGQVMRWWKHLKHFWPKTFGICSHRRTYSGENKAEVFQKQGLTFSKAFSFLYNRESVQRTLCSRLQLLGNLSALVVINERLNTHRISHELPERQQTFFFLFFKRVPVDFFVPTLVV